jgi:hypothetical protein
MALEGWAPRVAAAFVVLAVLAALLVRRKRKRRLGPVVRRISHLYIYPIKSCHAIEVRCAPPSASRVARPGEDKRGGGRARHFFAQTVRASADREVLTGLRSRAPVA